MASSERRSQGEPGQDGEKSISAGKSFFARRQAVTRGESPPSGSNLDWQFDDDSWPDDVSQYQPKQDQPKTSASQAPDRAEGGALHADAVNDAIGDAGVTRDPTAQAEQSLIGAFRGPQSAPRVAAVQRSLDDALFQWWSENEIPPPPVLRDGLLLLEAGYDLSESQRTLLLRAAIIHQRGVLTALSHQRDPELTGLLLAEALHDPNSPLTDVQVQQLVREDHNRAAWLPYLRAELTASAVDDVDRQRLELMRVYTGQALAELSESAAVSDSGADTRGYDSVRQFLVRALLVALAAVLIVGMLFGQQLRARARETISVPAGAHMVTDPASLNIGVIGEAKQTVALDSYHIDRYEVTVRDYRRCVAAGGCLWPSVPTSATRPDYLNNRAFELYPMINVDLAAAGAYCQWAGMRLPTAAEWEVAAAYAPATQRYYYYPWGDRFEPRYANSMANEPPDTQPVGFYHPFGSSSLGAADMAGNVAEWTATISPEDANRHLVKGGSYRDAPEALRTDAAWVLPISNAEQWLGFRCAMSKE